MVGTISIYYQYFYLLVAGMAAQVVHEAGNVGGLVRGAEGKLKGGNGECSHAAAPTLLLGLLEQ